MAAESTAAFRTISRFAKPRSSICEQLHDLPSATSFFSNQSGAFLPKLSDRTSLRRILPKVKGHGSDLQRSTWTKSVERRRRFRCCSGSDGNENRGEEGASKSGKTLKGVVTRKQVKLNAELQRLGTEGLEEKLRSVPRPQQPNRLLELIAERTVTGRTTLVAEIGRASPSETSEQLAERAAEYVKWGADAVAVCTDEELTSDGKMDLATVCHRLRETPVICRDWVLHPIQIVDIARAGASGFNLVQAVLGEGTPALLKIGLATGLDPIVEVVNLDEVNKVVERGGATLFGVNLSVGLSVSIPGFRQDVAKSLVQQLPFGAASIVAVSSVEEARLMKAAGADAIWVKREALQPAKGEGVGKDRVQALLIDLADAMTGDD